MSPLESFQGCRNRLVRADFHRKALEKSWSEFIKEDPYYPFLEMEDDGTGRLVLHTKYSPLPDIFSLELGEMLYQLRAALDASIYASAIQQSGQNPPPNGEYLEFPICDSLTKFNNAARKIHPLSDKLVRIIESVQPYNTPKNISPESMVYSINRTLAILNDWARKDRHRNLRVVGSWISNSNPIIYLPHGCSFVYMLVTDDHFLEDDNVIAEFKIDGFLPGMEIEANPDLAIDISVNEVPIPCADTDMLGKRIKAMFVFVKTIIDALEGSFEQVV